MQRMMTVQKLKIIKSSHCGQRDVRVRGIQTNKSPSYKEIVDVVVKLHGLEAEDSFTLKYEDADGDFVTIADDEDVRQSLLDAAVAKKVTLTVHVLAKSNLKHTRRSRPRCGQQWRGKCGGGGVAPNVFGFPLGDLHEIFKAISGEDIPPHLREWLGMTDEVAAAATAAANDPEADQPTPPPTTTTTEDTTASGVVTHPSANEVSPSGSRTKPHTYSDRNGKSPAKAETPYKISDKRVESEPEYVKVAAPRPGEDSGETEGIKTKQALLRDMGFEIDDALSAKLIKEMNGRIDLIVSALVKNNKL